MSSKEKGKSNGKIKNFRKLNPDKFNLAWNYLKFDGRNIFFLSFNYQK